MALHCTEPPKQCMIFVHGLQKTKTAKQYQIWWILLIFKNEKQMVTFLPILKGAASGYFSTFCERKSEGLFPFFFWIVVCRHIITQPIDMKYLWLVQFKASCSLMVMVIVFMDFQSFKRVSCILSILKFSYLNYRRILWLNYT